MRLERAILEQEGCAVGRLFARDDEEQREERSACRVEGAPRAALQPLECGGESRADGCLARGRPEGDTAAGGEPADDAGIRVSAGEQLERRVCGGVRIISGVQWTLTTKEKKDKLRSNRTHQHAKHVERQKITFAHKKGAVSTSPKRPKVTACAPLISPSTPKNEHATSELTKPVTSSNLSSSMWATASQT